jgi:hypothetical protein
VAFFLPIIKFFLQCKKQRFNFRNIPAKNIKEAIEGYLEVKTKLLGRKIKGENPLSFFKR